MSEQDQTQATGQARAREENQRAQVERSDRGSSSRGGGGGRRSGRRRHGGPQQPGHRPEPSLNMDELRELAELFTSHGLTDFEFENAEIRVRLSRSLAPEQTPQAPTSTATPPHTFTQPHTATPSASQSAPAAEGSAQAASGGAPAEETAEELHIITSPIVGTFYRSPSPNAEAFVKVGSRVEHDTVVCIIEAMKLMNEIQAETSGTVEKIYVENGQPVEYGQPLFGIKK
jgi:acetyl-CoA carboxylase biotin carboxyl carrier protein